MVTADDWTKSAMRDGQVVAELLVRLKKAKVRPVLFTTPTVPPPALRWGNRQSRSRKEADSARCSPSTPLSWSASSSPSAYLDGYETSSRRTTGSFPVGSRSKDIASRGDVSENKNFKRVKLNTENKDRGNFLLPDLNVMPCDDNGVDHYSSLGVETTSLYGG